METAQKATGLLRYLADMEFPEMLCAKVFYSDRPHALIRNIHTERAARARGVRAVLLAQDVPGRNRLGDAPNDPPLLAEGRVRYAGEAIALLAAEEEGLADEALNVIEVEYEDLPPLFCPEKAMEPDSPSLHEGGNLLCHLKIDVGDAEEALAKCDEVVEHTFRIPPLEHLPIETEGAVAAPGSHGLTIWAPTQAPFHVQRTVAACLAIPREDIRVIQTPCGGGFGSKAEGSIAVAARAALLAHHLQKPVKLFPSREESIISSTKRHACIIHYALGAQRNGRLLAARARIFLEKGAYSHWGGPI
ncbi:MAG: xanthine dehydrogenase family protein molybdopterin-binding subunit, partial [Nitrospinota bacterium]